MTAPPVLCPSADQLLAFDRGELPDPELIATADHLAVCPRCRSRLADALHALADPLLHDLRRLARADTSVAPPADAARTWVREQLPSFGAATGSYDPPDLHPGTVVAPPRDAAGAPAPANTAAVPAHETFGRYQLRGVLGEGGMGIVYRAYDPVLKRTVALKMIKAGRVSPEERGRFLAEAEAVARLQHPNVVQIYDLGEVAGQPYCALEYVAGGSLDRRVRDTLPNPRAAARLMIPLIRGIQAAHDLKIVHRDLKPANVLLAEGATTALDACTPKVTDFGLAKFLDADDGVTRADAVMGTPSYMAPEQAEGRIRDIGPGTDVYALGALLYDLLSGRPPFKGTTIRETLKFVIEEEPVPPRQLQTGVPRDLETICLKCLQKAPGHRYASAAALADDLERFLNGLPITARRVSPAEKALRWCKRKPALATLSGFSGVAAAALLAGAFWYTYAVADERRKKEVSEERAATERAGRETAEVKKQSAEDMRKASDYFASLTKARERIATREMGWTWAAEADARAATGIDTPARDPAALRSAFAAALAGTAVREAYSAGAGFHTRALCYHPNGRWLVLAEGRVGQGLGDLRARILDARTGAVVRDLPFPSGLVGGIFDPRPDMANAVAVSPDGRWLVVAARSGVIHRWDLRAKNSSVQSLKPETVPLGSSADCIGLAFSPDATALYVATLIKDDGTITRWDTATWERTARHRTERAYGHLIVHPMGTAVYCGGHGAMHELDPTTLEKRAEVRDLAGHAISPDGRVLAATRGRQLILWDTQKREPAYTLREPYREYAFGTDINRACFSPDGRLLAATSEHDRHAYLFDLITGERVADWQADEGTACSAFDPSSRFLATAGQKRSVVWEIGGQREHRAVAPQPYPFLAAGPSADGRTLGGLVSTTSSGTAPAAPGLWSLDADGAPEPFWSADAPEGHGQHAAVSFSRTGEQCAFVTVGEVRVFDRARHFAPVLGRKSDGLIAAAFAPDGRLWTIADETVTATRAAPPVADVLAWKNPTGRISGLASMGSLGVGRSWAVAGGLDGTLRVFPTATPVDAKTLTPTASVPLESRITLSAVAVSPDDRTAVVGSDSGKGFVVALPTGTVITTWEAHRDRVSAAVFLGPGLIATGGRDRAVRFWSWDGERVRELWAVRTVSAVTSLGASADGHRLTVTCEGERGVHVWDLAALNRWFAEVGLGIDAPASWAVPRLPAPEPPPAQSDPSTWPANGLRLDLFADRDLRALRLVRYDPTPYHNWGAGQPHPHVPHVFSARWTGFVKPPAAGKYQFRVTCANAIRVWFGGKLVANSWEPDRAGDRNLTFEADLTAAPHALRIELAHGRGAAFLALSWSRPGTFPEQPVSAAFLFHDEETAKAAKVPPAVAPENESFRFSDNNTVFTQVAASRDGRFVAAGTDGGAIVVWTTEGAAVATIKDAHRGAVSALEWSPDGRMLVSAAVAGGFAVWEVPEGKLLTRNTVHPGEVRIAFAPDGKSFVTSGSDKTAREWGTNSRTGGGIANLDFVPRSLYWDVSGAVLLAGNGGAASRWDVVAGKQSAYPATGFNGTGRAFASAHGLVTAEENPTDGSKGVLRLFDLATATERWSLWFEDAIGAVAVSADGRRLAVATTPRGNGPSRGSGSVRVYDLTTGRETDRLVGHASGVRDVKFSPDGRAVYTTGSEGTVRRWRIAPIPE